MGPVGDPSAREYISTAFPELGWNSGISYDGMIWNRALSLSEQEILNYSSPWDLYWQPSNRAYAWLGSASGPVVAGTARYLPLRGVA